MRKVSGYNLAAHSRGRTPTVTGADGLVTPFTHGRSSPNRSFHSWSAPRERSRSSPRRSSAWSRGRSTAACSSRSSPHWPRPSMRWRLPGVPAVRRRADGPDAHRPRPATAEPEGHDGRRPRAARSAAHGRVQLRRRGRVSFRVHELERRLGPAVGLVAAVPALDAATRDPLWNLRRAAMPLLYGMPGDRKPVTFVEDCAVAPERLPEFAARFREIFHRHGTDGAFYGHASVGCLHIRPVLNLNDPNDVVTMRRIMEEVTDLVLEFGGSSVGRTRRRAGPQRVEPQDVRAGGLRGVPPGEARLRPGQRAQPRQGRRRPGHGGELARRRPATFPPDPPTVFDYSKQARASSRAWRCATATAPAARRRAGRCAPATARRATRRTRRRARANALRSL